MLEKTQGGRSKRRCVLNVVVLGLITLLFVGKYRERVSSRPGESFRCQGFEPLLGKPSGEVCKILQSSQLQNETLSKLSNAVRIPTEMYDYFPDPGEEPEYEGWKPFAKLHEQLSSDFPLVWSKLAVEKVNEYALLLTWEGTEKDLKPVVFAAHMDVVPVEKKTWGLWEHEPFSGHWDGEFLWGRGSFDDKNMLIGVLQAVEYILREEPDFKPERGIVIALGSDEESTGRYGAKYISSVLLDRYGENGIYSIVDEGVNGVKNVEGVWIAAPGTGEKGFINVQFDVRTPGGHSSVPPDHTSIGISAEIIHDIESEAFPPKFTPENPVTQYYQCAAQYSETMDEGLRLDFLSAMEDEGSNRRVLEHLIKTGGKKTECLFKTTRAFDIINGGIKANALPESVSFLLNSRVSVESSVDETVSVFSNAALKVAKKYGLGYSMNEDVLVDATDRGSVKLVVERSLEPAPVSPNNEVWREFAGSIKGFYEKVVFPAKFQNSTTSLVVAPSIMTANTDTCHYWKLTKNIYRYQPGFAMEDTLSTIHSVNEHVDAETVMQVVGFYYNYIHLVNGQDF
ncbi:hypothetical protein HG536_0B03750 [Torulaspora globosa]|uniref:Peptidase M20 dimerisation domain-containing protein n=1 Tax=Torulaspora globosa TaxID=48254 RepID=A0A7G3ZDC6_9SACH|nr:uncharacterized protein HG536_0B03750 [Torulaspora globosa]QLL31512.1 hypothetical protein HG536_0B03750 [Torulaspora globosa]